MAFLATARGTAAQADGMLIAIVSAANSELP
jgi:hypothetical protein